MTTSEDIEAAILALQRGDLAIIPTDTVYGLAAAGEDSAAVETMFSLKRRPVDRMVAVLVADLEQAQRFVHLGPLGRALAETFWPGPLTIVAARHAIGSLAVGDDESLGVRCPDDAACRALAAAVGPIAATSANLHGHPTPKTAAEVARLFPDIDAVIDDGPRPGAASTVVSVVGEVPEIIRDGPISSTDIDVAFDRGS
jgi:L-threonylcarbamoyladenylate synthase